MISSIYSLAQKTKARKQLEKIFNNTETSLIIHYACESFFKQKNESTPRISCISIKNLGSGNVTSFSAHHVAEKEKIQIEQTFDRYDEIEKKLLDEYFAFVQENQGYTWAHWNMRNVNFGFQALEHRYAVLGGQPIVLQDARKLDISNLMADMYGPSYCEKPVLANLCKMNNIVSDFFMEGKYEAEAFEEKDFLRIHQSNMKKVDFIHYVAELALKGQLRTNSTWVNTHGVHPRVVVELIQKNWVYGLVAISASVFTFLTLLLG